MFKREVADQQKNGEWRFLYAGESAVDSFFCIGGLLLAYLSTDNFIKLSKSSSRFFKSFILHLANRWMRLTPLVMAVAWSVAVILPIGTSENTALSQLNGNFLSK